MIPPTWNSSIKTTLNLWWPADSASTPLERSSIGLSNGVSSSSRLRTVALLMLSMYSNEASTAHNGPVHGKRNVRGNVGKHHITNKHTRGFQNSVERTKRIRARPQGWRNFRLTVRLRVENVVSGVGNVSDAHSSNGADSVGRIRGCWV